MDEIRRVDRAATAVTRRRFDFLVGFLRDHTATMPIHDERMDAVHAKRRDRANVRCLVEVFVLVALKM